VQCIAKLPVCHSLHTSVWFTHLINDAEGGVGLPERPVAVSRVYLTVGHNCKLSLPYPVKNALFICPVHAVYPPTAPSLRG